jgi:2-polyprenyl-3-methyl-5-hydroxy-6-metoxy-1,4-benzoquinol methylase
MEASGSERFDLISLIHVLEHLPDPVSSLAQLRERWLTPDGAFFAGSAELVCAQFL